MKDYNIVNNQSNEEEIADYIGIWQHSYDAKLYDKINVADDWQKVRRRMTMQPRSKRIPFRVYAMRIAAVIILAVGLIFGLKQLTSVFDGVTKPVEIYAGAEMKKIELPDKSEVILNKYSKITYNPSFGSEERKLELEGEAFFSVERNENVPFTIYADDAVIKVLGTRFNVQCDSTVISVGVIEGTVAFYDFYDRTQKIKLEKGQTGRYYIEKQEIEKTDLIDPTLLEWANMFYFNYGTPLEDALQIIAQHYKKELIVQDEIEEGLTVRGLYEGDSLNEVLNNVKSTLGKKLEIILTKNEIIVHN